MEKIRLKIGKNFFLRQHGRMLQDKATLRILSANTPNIKNRWDIISEYQMYKNNYPNYGNSNVTLCERLCIFKTEVVYLIGYTDMIKKHKTKQIIFKLN